MKLHGLDGQFPMPNAHDHAVLGFGRHFQAGRESLFAREQRVVAAYFEAFGQPFEDAHIAMNHGGRLAVHRIVEHAQFAAERFYDSLQSQAHAKHRNARASGKFHQIGNTEIGGAARTRRDQDQVRRQVQDQLMRNSRAIGHHFGAGLARVVGQRVDEAVVVVHQQQV